MKNLFIPAQLPQLSNATISQLIGDYYGYLLDIPEPIWGGVDPAIALRGRLEEAISALEEELMVRRGEAVLEQYRVLEIA